MPKAPAKPKQKQIKKIGEATASRMKTKLDALKQKDEDIESNDSADEGRKKEEFLVGMEDDDMGGRETAEEKRLRMTKAIISEYGQADRTDFFATLTAKTQQDLGVMQDDDDVMTKRLKMQALEHKHKLFYKLADSFCGNS
jgi:hypothetical protein